MSYRSMLITKLRDHFNEGEEITTAILSRKWRTSAWDSRRIIKEMEAAGVVKKAEKKKVTIFKN